MDHSILLNKIKSMVSGKRPCLFGSYLSGWFPIVSLNRKLSVQVYIHCGVPQESVLGPYFLLYLNEIVNINIGGHFTIFAEDTTLQWHSRNGADLADMTDADIVRVKQWCEANYLSFNVSKTNAVCFKCDFNGRPNDQ